MTDLVEHFGGCHCGAVRYKVLAPADLDVMYCNCTICDKKQNYHFIVPKARFTLLQGEDFITTYTFNTRKAKHTFCKVCGVQSFYTPRSNQDGYGIMPHCLDPGTVTSTSVKYFDGQNWEDAYSKSDIQKYSKAEGADENESKAEGKQVVGIDESTSKAEGIRGGEKPLTKWMGCG